MSKRLLDVSTFAAFLAAFGALFLAGGCAPCMTDEDCQPGVQCIAAVCQTPPAKDPPDMSTLTCQDVLKCEVYESPSDRAAGCEAGVPSMTVTQARAAFTEGAKLCFSTACSEYGLAQFSPAASFQDTNWCYQCIIHVSSRAVCLCLGSCT